MKVEISKSEFMDRMRAFDSCSLDYGELSALFDYINDEIAEGIISDDIRIGDWAIVTHSTTLEQLSEEYEVLFVDFDEVIERIQYDHLGNSAVNAIDCGETIVIIGA